ncbi:MAG: hydroxyacid dehydrogenase, partial [Lachnospiraceae bacterium]|nr:hydroxyacid dehydrogenase [Lachnospiraceae bacterium]
DYVTLHVPVNDSTKGMINAKVLGLMKQNAFLINTARGPIVDSEALAKALNTGRIAGAGIDVFEMEPPIPADHPLLRAKNTLLTPHVAFATKEALERRAGIVFDNMFAWLGNEIKNKIC